MEHRQEKTEVFGKTCITAIFSTVHPIRNAESKSFNNDIQIISGNVVLVKTKTVVQLVQKIANYVS
jgi:hypothetical protein